MTGLSLVPTLSKICRSLRDSYLSDTRENTLSWRSKQPNRTSHHCLISQWPKLPPSVTMTSINMKVVLLLAAILSLDVDGFSPPCAIASTVAGARTSTVLNSSYTGGAQRTFSTESSSKASTVGMNNPGVPFSSAMQQVGRNQPTTSVNANDDEVWDSLRPVTIQGGSLRTWSFSSQAIQSVQVHLKSNGRPINANIDLWSGPDNTPERIGVYVEDGNMRPFRAIIATPRGSQNAVAIRNTAEMAFPLTAAVEADSLRTDDGISSGVHSLDQLAHILYTTGRPKTIQGGAVHTIPFAPAVASIWWTVYME